MERIGVGFSSGLQPKEVVECVKYAETLGYESAWMAEAHAGDQFCILTGGLWPATFVWWSRPPFVCSVPW